MPYSIYLHIPFCRRRCAYCDFNTYAGREALLPAYVTALCNEIALVARSAPERLKAHTIFFGGGTPSLLAPKQFERILNALHASFTFVPAGDSAAAEISLEANPGTLSPAALRDLRSLGFNRLSLGVQSAQEDELRRLGRIHSFQEAVHSAEWARQAGFDNLSLDLIFGLPQQPLDRWQATVRAAAALAPEHLSLYALTIEPGTPWGRLAARGLLPLPDPDLGAEMYEWAADFLEAQGYLQYEISNWARRKEEQKGREASTPNPPAAIPHSPFECQHNLQYWRNLPYLGFGAGAHGYAAGLRYSNVLRIKTYLERLGSRSKRTVFESGSSSHPFPLSPAAVHHHRISALVEMQETLFTGLRLTNEGVSAQGFQERFGLSLQEAFGTEIKALIQAGLLEWAGPPPGLVRLTRRGRLLGNQVFMRFVG